jgi:hypothetical protein
MKDCDYNQDGAVNLAHRRAVRLNRYERKSWDTIVEYAEA